MFSSKEKKNDYEITTTVIGIGTVIECARFKSKGTVRLSGKIIGDMTIDGDIIMDENGKVEGNIEAKKILSAGNILGNITCEEEIHLTGTSNLVGNIVSASVIVDEGAVFCGNCQIKKKGLTVPNIKAVDYDEFGNNTMHA